jgi:hypothetical protein
MNVEAGGSRRPLADPGPLLDVARRIVETAEEETRALRAGAPAEGGQYAERKALLLLELTRAARGVDLSAETTRAGLARLRAAVEENHATIGLRLEAARRVAETLKRVVADIESDGTYVAGKLTRWAAR